MSDPAKASIVTKRQRGRRLLILFAVIVLTCSAFVVFWPSLGFEFVDFDVDDLVVENPHIRGLTIENLKHILTSRCVSSYYPARTLTLALDYHFWELNPRGYKLTNLLIHVANVLLVFWLIVRILGNSFAGEGSRGLPADVIVAAFCTGVFAVHPVVVEPVVWLGGREELLMTLGALGCLHFHMAARCWGRGKTRRVLFWHVCATACCAAACLSNAVGAVIPFLITTWDALTLGRPRLFKALVATLPLWVVSVGTIVIKQINYSGDTIEPLAAVFSAEWLMLVLRTYWLNLTTLAWPTNLGVLYEWVLPHSFLETEVLAGAGAAVLTVAVTWKLRRRRPVLFGLLWFLFALAPTSQVMLHHIPRADRFLYLPLVGLVLAVAAGWSSLTRVRHRHVITRGLSAMVALCISLLALRSCDQIRTWRDSVALWRQCVKVAPDNPLAHGCLADNLAARGRFDLAIPHYQLALELEPDNRDTLNNFAIRLATWEEESLRDYNLAIRLAERGCELAKWRDPRLRRTLAKACANLAVDLQNAGTFDRAVEYHTEAIKADPKYEVPLFNLAVLYATCPDDEFHRPQEALRLAERAWKLTEQADAVKLRALGVALAGAGQFERAISVTEDAARVAQSLGDTGLVQDLQRRLEWYRSGRTVRDVP